MLHKKYHASLLPNKRKVGYLNSKVSFSQKACILQEITSELQVLPFWSSFDGCHVLMAHLNYIIHTENMKSLNQEEKDILTSISSFIKVSKFADAAQVGRLFLIFS